MFRKYITLLIVCFFSAFLLSCGNNTDKKSSEPKEQSQSQNENSEDLEPKRLEYFPSDDETELYNFIAGQLAELGKNDKIYLSECQCLSNFKRDFNKVDLSSRYQLDRLATNYMLKENEDGKTLNLVFFGSGTLLNELTIIAKLSQAGFNLQVHLMDMMYFLHDSDEAMDKLKYYREHRDEIPEHQAWDMYYWDMLDLDGMLEAFEFHYRALDQFQELMGSISRKFSNSINVTVSENSHELGKVIRNKQIDAVFAADSYQTIVYVIWNLIYHPFYAGNDQLPFESTFILLNKDQEDGNFAMYGDLNAKVNLEINRVKYMKNDEVNIKLLHREVITDLEIDVVKDYF